MINYDTIKRTFIRLKEIKIESGKGFIEIAKDYYKLSRNIRISFYEYYKFEFEKQPEAFRNSFLSSANKYRYLEILNPRKYYILARNKYITHLFLEDAGIDKAELYCYYDRIGRTDNKRIGYDYESVLKILKNKKVNTCMIKPTESSHGKGVLLITSIDYANGSCYLKNHKGEVFELSQLLNKDPLIFESIIEQTAQFKRFNASSVNTVRFITMLSTSGEAEIITAFVKIGKQGSCIDNAGDGGNIDAAINIPTGEICFAMQFDGWRKTKPISNHPENGTQLNGVLVENWESIKNKVIRFQQAMPFLRAIGWDIAITDQGPVVVEINDFWDETGQLFVRKGWKPEIESCYQEWKKYGVVL